MASMKRPRGRPKLPGSNKTIKLRDSVFALWERRKKALGFVENTNSEFAEYLLHRRVHQKDETSKQLEEFSISFGSNSKVARPLLVSTPMSAARRPLMFDESSEQIDVTGVTTASSSTISTDADNNASDLRWQTRCQLFDTSQEEKTDNPFSSIDKFPPEEYEPNDSAQSENEYNTASKCTSNIDEHLYEDNAFPEIDRSVDPLILELNGSDSSSSDESEDESEDESNESEEESNENTELFGDESMVMSCDDDDERTLTMIDPCYGEDDNEECSEHLPSNSATNAEPDDLEEDQDNSIEKNGDKVVQVLTKSFNDLTNGKNLEEYIKLQERTRVIVSVEKLLELCSQKCGVCDTLLTANMEDVKSIGSRVEIFRKCKNGHVNKWVSSEVLGIKKNSECFATDAIIAAAIIISGNNYSKISLLCHALNLKICSLSTFSRFQKLCAAPIVNQFWGNMNELTIGILKQYQDLCLCGDGRNDSPGHSARYCVYTLMEHTTKVIVDMAVVDKRETGGNSVSMEKEGLRRLLERLADTIPLSEITTDASTSVIKLVRDMKDTHPQLLELFHSLDIWHKAKKLSKCLHKAAKVKGCEPLKQWVDDVVNHFWFACQNSKGSVLKLKEVWFGVVHHVCGEHKWAEGSCDHDDTVAQQENKHYLAKSSQAAAALKKVVMDPKWLNNLEFYVRFRHTSVLESYNSMLTKYAPKRMAFEYPYFIMRVMLAAIDHNMHLVREKKLTANGNVRGHRKYSKRTQKFHAEIVKKEKSYHYFPYLVGKMLKERVDLLGSVLQASDDNAFNPKKIAPTIGMKPPPPTMELLKAPSRLGKQECKSSKELQSPK